MSIDVAEGKNRIRIYLFKNQIKQFNPGRFTQYIHKNAAKNLRKNY